MPTTGQLNAAAANFPSKLSLDLYLSDELNGCTGAYNTTDGQVHVTMTGTHAAQLVYQLTD